MPVSLPALLIVIPRQQVGQPPLCGWYAADLHVKVLATLFEKKLDIGCVNLASYKAAVTRKIFGNLGKSFFLVIQAKHFGKQAKI